MKKRNYVQAFPKRWDRTFKFSSNLEVRIYWSQDHKKWAGRALYTKNTLPERFTWTVLAKNRIDIPRKLRFEMASTKNPKIKTVHQKISGTEPIDLTTAKNLIVDYKKTFPGIIIK